MNMFTDESELRDFISLKKRKNVREDWQIFRLINI
jgi:hypothetical protein